MYLYLYTIILYFNNFLNYLFDKCACKILNMVDSIFSVNYSYSTLCCNEYLDKKITLYRF